MKLLSVILPALFICVQLSAQTESSVQIHGEPMRYEVIDGDTVYFDVIDPAWVFPKGFKMKKDDWRRHYKLVYNFNKVYPFALVGRKMMAQVDSIMAADITKKSQKSKYTHDVEVELFKIFEQDIRHMTVSQGMVLMRLVDRECGMTPYEIIKEYRNGTEATFWQLIAKLFGANLKKPYDPKGKDAKIEELVKIWESGQWEIFYHSIFWEAPPKTKINVERLSSEVRKK